MAKKQNLVNEPAQEEAVVVPTKEMVEQNMRLEELNKLRITTKTVVPPESGSVIIDDIPFFELGDIGAIKAKQKAGKTTTLKALCAAWMNGSFGRLRSGLENPKVLWIDTEQKDQDVKRIINDVKQMSSQTDEYIDRHLKLFPLRSRPCKKLMEDTQLLVDKNHPQVVIIDGLVDYIESFNDEALSHQLINELVMLCDQYKCSVIAVLHENKSSDNHNMRGHLGTMLAQKSGTVLQCTKDKRNDITVSSSDSRHAAVPSWKLRYDDYGHIVPADGQQADPALVELTRRANLTKRIVQEQGGSISRKDLTKRLMEELKLSRSRVANIISEQLKNIICEVNKQIRLQPELDWPL